MLMLWMLPDTPSNARFLSQSQKVRAVERVQTNQTVLKSNHFRWDHLLEALVDVKIWLLVLFLICMTICNSSITAFSQIVLVGLGFDVSAELITIKAQLTICTGVSGESFHHRYRGNAWLIRHHRDLDLLQV